MGELVFLSTRQEPWLSKRQLMGHLGCSKRWLEYRTAEGCPSRLLGGQRRYRVSEVEEWLRANDHLKEGA